MTTRTIHGLTVLSLAVAGMVTAQAQSTNHYSFTFPVTNTIPDGNSSGFADSRNLTGVAGTIADLNVTLNLNGGFNGDLYAYLEHDGGFAVLLNRVGVSSTNQFGYPGDGMSITLDDQAANNVHWYETFSFSLNSSGQLLGAWQPDGRNVDPDLVNETDAPTATLSGFNGQSADGTWTLFVADMSSGGTSVLSSWGLDVASIPEPATIPLLVLCNAALVLFRHRKPVGPVPSKPFPSKEKTEQPHAPTDGLPWA